MMNEIITVSEGLLMSRETAMFLAKRNIVDNIYSAARLEGIAVTFPQTNEIYEGRSVSGLTIEDVIKINNLKHAWQFVFDTVDYPIDLRYICQLSSKVGEGIVYQAGVLRMANVSIGGTSYMPEIPVRNQVEAKISSILKNDDATERALDMMLYLMRAQLFMDGNKRVAQLAANQMLIQDGVGILNIPVDKQLHFFDLLIEFYETNHAEELKAFLKKYAIEELPEMDAVREQEDITLE